MLHLQEIVFSRTMQGRDERSVCLSVCTEIARHQLEQQRLGERLREQEERLKGLNAAQSSMGLLPSFPGPAPLFPPIMGDPTRPPDVSGGVWCVELCDSYLCVCVGRDASPDGAPPTIRPTTLQPSSTHGAWHGTGE